MTDAQRRCGISLGDRDRADAHVVSWIPAGGPPRRLVFEPRSGDAASHERVEEVLRDGDWEPVGREFVDEVAIETPD